MRKYPPIAPGQRFGRLTVLGDSPKRDKQGKPYYYACKCDCCPECNIAKMTREAHEFISHALRVAAHQASKKTEPAQ